MTSPVFPSIPFLTGVLYQVARLLGVDYRNGDLSATEMDRYAGHVNRHVADAWRLSRWPELYVTEERTLGPSTIWLTGTQYARLDVVYFLDTNLYYQAVHVPAVGSDPVTDTYSWDPYTLTAGDYYLPFLQDCRRRIGEVAEVYGSNPRVLNGLTPPRGLNWQLSERGIELYGAGPTVFIRHKIPALEYTGDAYVSTQTYLPGDLMLYRPTTGASRGGEVYRALQAIAGHTPEEEGSDAAWARVPFPKRFADYVVLMTACDEADDLQTSAKFAQQAQSALNMADDDRLKQVGFARYRLNRGPWVSCGCSLLPAVDVVSTLTATCQNEWGDVVAAPTDPGEDPMMNLQLSVPFVPQQGYLDIPFGVTAIDTGWKLESGSIEYTGDLTDSEVTIFSWEVKNRTTTGFRLLLDGIMDDDAADYVFKCAISGATA